MQRDQAARECTRSVILRSSSLAVCEGPAWKPWAVWRPRDNKSPWKEEGGYVGKWAGKRTLRLKNHLLSHQHMLFLPF